MASVDKNGQIFVKSGFLTDVIVKVHPVVPFNILNHFSRRNESQHRVIGTLLGSIKGNEVEVSNCFPVPHNESADQVAVDMEYHKTMFELHQKVRPREIIVGWYATGESLTEHSILIHDFYGREISQAVHLLVNPDAQQAGVITQAYVSTTLDANERALAYHFQEVPVATAALDAEQQAVDYLVRTKDAEHSLSSEIDNLESSVGSLLNLLKEVRGYVQRVLNKEIPHDDAIGRQLWETLAAVPSISPAFVEEAFNDNLQDLLMVIYLANLTRTQLALTEKIRNTL